MRALADRVGTAGGAGAAAGVTVPAISHKLMTPLSSPAESSCAGSDGEKASSVMRVVTGISTSGVWTLHSARSMEAFPHA